jgi:multidrug efflux pump subunit AcrA (membrane-fusion protein)
MIIPTLVLVTAMQFGDPQSGARIDDLSLSPLRDVPATGMSASPAGQSNDFPPGSVTNPLPIPIPTPPTTYSPEIGVNGDSGVSSNITVPDRTMGNPYMPMPPREGLSTAPSTSYRPTTTLYGNGNGSNGTGNTSESQGEYRAPTRIENNKVMTRGKVEFDKITQLSTPVAGIILEQRTDKCDAHGKVMRNSNGQPIKIDLQRGVMVFAEQQIAQLDDRHAQAQYSVAQTKLAVAKMEAEQTIGIDYAEAQYKTAFSDYKRSYEIAKRTAGAVTAAELEVKEFKVIESQLQMKKAENDHKNQQESVKVQEQEVAVAQTQLDLRKIKTPFNGMVVNVVSQVGRSLREGDVIAEVAQLDKLKVSAQIDGNRITQEQVDKKRVTVTVRKPNGQEDMFEGFVRYAAPMFDFNRQFPVEIEVDNRLVNEYWQLREGDYVDVVIHL